MRQEVQVVTGHMQQLEPFSVLQVAVLDHVQHTKQAKLAVFAGTILWNVSWHAAQNGHEFRTHSYRAIPHTLRGSVGSNRTVIVSLPEVGTSHGSPDSPVTDR